ncbi:MAG: ATP-binding protein [Desulfobacterales bacterium]
MNSIGDPCSSHLKPEIRAATVFENPDDLVTDTVALCADSPAGDFDNTLSCILARIGASFRSDRCYACVVDESGHTIVERVDWRAGSPCHHALAKGLPISLSDRHLGRLRCGEIVQLAGLSPPGPTGWRNSTADQTVQYSSLLAPLINGGAMTGFLGMDFAANNFHLARTPIGMVKTLTGIIALAWAGARHEKKRRLFQTAVEQAAELVLIATGDGTIEYVNPALERVSGFSHGELLERHPAILTSGLQDPDFCQDIWRTISTGRTWQGRFTNRRKCGTHYTVEAVIVPARGKGGNVCNFVGVARDVTEENHLQRQLIQSQKMEAIGTLAGGIAHDFNNILSAILGYAELAAYEMPAGSPGRQDVAEVINAGNRAKDLVRQILTFSRKTEHEFKPINIVPLLKEALKFLRASLPSTIDIRTRITAENARILCSPTMIQQILMNLCTNAAQAMKDCGGILTVNLADSDVRADEIAAGFQLRPGPYVRLTVSDTGPGIDPQILARIFDPYFTTKEKGEGTGLGLSVVHGIIQTLKGSIAVDSPPGGGAAFHVRLPCITSDEEPAVIRRQAAPTGTERILLADDEDVLTAMGKQMLEHLGYRVTVRTDSLEALKTFQSHPRDFDLIISDKTMPRMTGFELAEQIKTIRPDIPIILCTGYCGEFEIERAAALGISRLVVKPLGMNELAEAVRSALDAAPKAAGGLKHIPNGLN